MPPILFGIATLANSNLRELCQIVEQLDAQYQWLSLQIGFGAAALAAPFSYLWLEHRAAREESVLAAERHSSPNRQHSL